MINSNNRFYSILFISKVQRNSDFWDILEAYHLEDSRGEHKNFSLSDKLGYAAITNNSQIFVAYSYKDSFRTHITWQVGVMLKK